MKISDNVVNGEDLGDWGYGVPAQNEERPLPFCVMLGMSTEARAILRSM